MSEHVFVYGSLKRGEPNHPWLEGSRFLGRRRLGGARLHDLGPYPMAVAATEAEAQDAQGPQEPALIHGELYALETSGLARLDLLEDVPREYQRQRCQLSDGSRAWVYVGRHGQVIGLPLVPYGDWRSTPVFSYGSNLCPTQLARRCPRWDGSGLVARLEGWRWGINKRRLGRAPGEGAAGLVRHSGAHCWGVVHHHSPDDRAALDRCEGVAAGHYRHQCVTVTTSDGERFEALTYVPTPAWSAPGLAAGPDYARAILRGAHHWRLPGAWLGKLEAALRLSTEGGNRINRPGPDPQA
ncbi:gamma-glutamylcyclotransferase [Synechococcus sp. 1G10]|uniref:gamma-glutamylcyclotransferase n=1 Tax=Synechococcus sp. 1G10 TaxID=2025605 RepID=UPI0013034DE9|nr:gamma-glutamylcyclotransferase [Synechococcus sp. 1G10]